MIVLRLTALVIAWLCVIEERAIAQAPPQLLYVVGADGRVVLPDVRAVATGAGGLAILSQPEPAMHIRDAQGRIVEWGRTGQGPGDVADPVDFAWTSSGVLLLDMGNRRLASFTNGGKSLWATDPGCDCLAR